MTRLKGPAWRILLFVLLALAGRGEPRAQDRPLSPAHKAWLEDEVAWIITGDERDAFLRLETDAERDTLIREFWRRRDPTPDTSRNESKEEHYRRLAFADKAFGVGTSLPGRRTERGRIYVALGPPLAVERFKREWVRPLELWTIQGNPSIGKALVFKILFFQKEAGGDYKLYSTVFDSPKKLVRVERRAETGMTVRWAWDAYDIGAYEILQNHMLIDVLDVVSGVAPRGRDALASVTPSAILAEMQKYLQKKVDDSYAAALLAHRAPDPPVTAVKRIGLDATLAAWPDSSGRMMLHCALAPETVSFDRFGDDYLAEASATLRLIDPLGRTRARFERPLRLTLKPGELLKLRESSFVLYDAVPVEPGHWTASIQLDNRVTNEYAAIEKEITVPPADGAALGPVILARRLFRSEAGGGDEACAFQVGPVQAYPPAGGIFPEKTPFSAVVPMRGIADADRKGALIQWTLTIEGRIVWTMRMPLSAYSDRSLLVQEIPGPSASVGRLGVALFGPDGREILSAETEARWTADPVPPLWSVIRPISTSTAAVPSRSIRLLQTGGRSALGGRT